MSENAGPTKYEIYTEKTLIGDVSHVSMDNLTMATFFEPGNEANARKFVHMDELIDAVKDILKPVHPGQKHTEYVLARAAAKDRARAILAKIGGGE